MSRTDLPPLPPPPLDDQLVAADGHAPAAVAVPAEAPPTLAEQLAGEPAAPSASSDPTRISAHQQFWSARPELERILAFARARRSSPWAVLAYTLARVVTSTSPKLVLPPIIGGVASLNLYAGVVGTSGQGKGSAAAAAADVLDGDTAEVWELGTGEGILKRFVHYRKATKDQPGGLVQHNDRVLFDMPEVDHLNVLKNRQGATLMPQVRKAYMAEALSFANASDERALKLERHTYRLCLVVGIQPERSEALLHAQEVAGGTPQRFLWVPATDPEAPDQRPAEPAPLTWQLNDYLFDDPQQQTVMDVCATAVDLIDGEHLKRQRDDGDALDGHALLTRLKWAGALALLAGRTNVTDDDWQLSATLMAVSDATRARCLTALGQQAARHNRAKGQADGQRAAVAEEAAAEERLRRVSQLLASKLDNGGEHAQAQLRKSLRSTDRSCFDEAINRLLSAGQALAEQRPNPQGRATTYYRPAR